MGGGGAGGRPAEQGLQGAQDGGAPPGGEGDHAAKHKVIKQRKITRPKGKEKRGCAPVGGGGAGGGGEGARSGGAAAREVGAEPGGGAAAGDRGEVGAHRPEIKNILKIWDK